MTLQTVQNLFETYQETSLFGRYICRDHIQPLIKKHEKNLDIKTIGTSVLGEPIDVINFGYGPKKILMWSQMHGNESTTTKAVMDVCNVFSNTSNEKELKNILESCTISIIPMLNPDGAKLYTRSNANDIDLNRDAKDLTQPESLALRSYFDAFNPDFCFNLHGQRTIFSAGKSNNPATVSFLAPAQDVECTVTDTRKKAMEVIVKMNENLQLQIPNQVGIYDDAFNVNCVGDTFQSLKVPTILFEAGHYPQDYNREKVRELIFQSLMMAVHSIATDSISGKNYECYLEIPENQKLFYDIIIRNAQFNGEKTDVAIQYQEILSNELVEFIPIVDKISDLSGFFGHKEVEANGCVVLSATGTEIVEGSENDFVLINLDRFSLKP